MPEIPRPEVPMKDRINHLKEGLHSVIVLEAEEGHFVYPKIQTWDPQAGAAENEGEIYIYQESRKKWVIDKEAVTEPNIELREAAREELQAIYDADQSVFIQLQAGRALGKSRYTILMRRLIS